MHLCLFPFERHRRLSHLASQSDPAEKGLIETLEGGLTICRADRKLLSLLWDHGRPLGSGCSREREVGDGSCLLKCTPWASHESASWSPARRVCGLFQSIVRR